MSTSVLIVGAADTGRAPMAAALLRRLLANRKLDWTVESAGILGHDGDPAEPEARSAMVSLNLDIDQHRARSLTDDMVAAATVLVVVDSGTARVVRMRYPPAAARTVTLGELAERQRDIPDPFRMQIGVWISYAREIEGLLHTGLDRLIAMVSGAESTEEGPAEARISPTALAQRSAPIERCERLLTLMRDMPALVEWPNARRQLEAEIKEAGAVPLAPGDLAQSYGAMLLTLLAMISASPTPAQIGLLLTAVGRLHASIDQAAITALSAEMARWATLA